MNNEDTTDSSPSQQQLDAMMLGPRAPKRSSRSRKLSDHSHEPEQTAQRTSKRTNAEAEWPANQLNLIFEALEDGLAVYDADGNLVRVNAAALRILGVDAAASPEFVQLSVPERNVLCDRRDVQGRPIEPEDLPVIRALRGEVFTGVHAMENWLRTLDGRQIETTTSAVPLRDQEGRIIGAVAILRDQTELNQLAREREETQANMMAVNEVNERLDTFFRMATHDLRAPVAASRMAIQLARRHVRRESATLDPNSQPAATLAQVATTLEATEQKVDHALRLLQQLLDVSQARAGTLVLQPELHDLGALVQAAVEEQQLLEPSRTMTVEMASPVMVMADGDRIGQVVTNYLTNALRYAPKDEPIHVAVRRADGMAQVEVRDFGPGIASDEQETIWARFQQARTSSGAQGLGLGLYIARMVVELHGGQVGVDSQLDHGSLFWFTLPIAPASV